VFGGNKEEESYEFAFGVLSEKLSVKIALRDKRYREIYKIRWYRDNSPLDGNCRFFML